MNIKGGGQNTQSGDILGMAGRATAYLIGCGMDNNL
jgi:hypothetical protein